MNQNTKEVLILELTKAKVGKQHIDNPTNTNLTKAEFWIECYFSAFKILSSCFSSSSFEIFVSVFCIAFALILITYLFFLFNLSVITMGSIPNP